MARARNIKPGFFRNEELAGLPFEYRLLFIGLWTLADREGRLEDRPKRIRMEVFPADSVDCEAGINALETCGLVVRYQVQGNAYIWIPTFIDHQKPHPREVASTIPPYQGDTKATPRHDQGDAKALSSPADVLNPDVLNPESLSQPTPAVVTETTVAPLPAAGVVAADAAVPPPNPAVAAAVDALRVGLATGTAHHEAAGELWAVLKANGCKGTAAHPSVIEMVQAGVTVDELRKAIAEARKSNGGTLNPAYLASIIDRMRTSPAKANGKSAAWNTDDHALEAKARELGMWPTRAPTYHDLRVLVRAKLATLAEESVR